MLRRNNVAQRRYNVIARRWNNIETTLHNVETTLHNADTTLYEQCINVLQGFFGFTQRRFDVVSTSGTDVVDAVQR